MDVDHETWLAQVTEDIVDPDREIVDPHHHLFSGGRLGEYLVPELVADTGSGHRVTRTVHVECGHAYRARRPGSPAASGRDRVRGSRGGRVRGAGWSAHRGARRPRRPSATARRSSTRCSMRTRPPVEGCSRAFGTPAPRRSTPRPSASPGRAPAGLYLDADFQRGVRHLGERGLTYDTWHYHHQNREFFELARAVPETTIVLDHFGTPLGVGPFAGRHDEIFETWTGRHRRHRRVPERGGEARRTGHARQRLRLGHRRPAADQRRARGRPGALVPPHDRVASAPIAACSSRTSPSTVGRSRIRSCGTA